MMSRGARFGSAVGLVRWHLSASLGGLRAIRYQRDRATRDVFESRRRDALFALTSLCLASVADERQARVLRLAYVEGLSDLRIAERAGIGESTVRRERLRGLRAVEARARELAHEARRLTGEALLGEA